MYTKSATLSALRHLFDLADQSVMQVFYARSKAYLIQPLNLLPVTCLLLSDLDVAHAQLLDVLIVAERHEVLASAIQEIVPDREEFDIVLRNYAVGLETVTATPMVVIVSKSETVT